MWLTSPHSHTSRVACSPCCAPTLEQNKKQAPNPRGGECFILKGAVDLQSDHAGHQMKQHEPPTRRPHQSSFSLRSASACKSGIHAPTEIMTSVQRYPRTILSTPGTSGYRLSYKQVIRVVPQNLPDRVSFNRGHDMPQ